jgi:hypothetical protein
LRPWLFVRREASLQHTGEHRGNDGQRDHHNCHGAEVQSTVTALANGEEQA